MCLSFLKNNSNFGQLGSSGQTVIEQHCLKLNFFFWFLTIPREIFHYLLPRSGRYIICNFIVPIIPGANKSINIIMDNYSVTYSQNKLHLIIGKCPFHQGISIFLTILSLKVVKDKQYCFCWTK